MRHILQLGFAATLALTAGTASAETYIRKQIQEINVQVIDGKLFCTRVSDQFEICNGMTADGDDLWRGGSMKHPDMPEFMLFEDTVFISSSLLKFSGCSRGICDAETWQKQ